MVKKSVARQYARSLQQAASGAEFGKLTAQAAVFGEVLSKNPELVKVFQNPSVAGDKKDELLDKIGQKLGFERLFVSFLKLVVERRRISLWKEIEASLSEISDSLEGVARGVVVSAEPIEQAKVAQLEKEISGRLRKRTVLKAEVNPSVLGGYKVKLGSLVFDGTFEKALEDIRNSLLKR